MSSQTTPATKTEDDPSNMPLLAHLNDLRKRLTYAAISLFVCTVISFVFAEPLLEYLMQPYVQSVPDAVVELQALRPTEGIETFFKVSIMAGAILSMPFILIQLWLFIKPGLTDREARYIYIFVPSAMLLFIIGILFAWFILVPAAINFLANFMADIFRTDWTGQEYISFVVRMLFWIGVSFEMPVVMYFLGRVGIVTSQMLREQWRVAVVGTAVLAAIITPSIDPVTMMLTMGPLFILYLISIGTAGIGQRQFAQSVSLDTETAV